VYQSPDLCATNRTERWWSAMAAGVSDHVWTCDEMAAARRAVGRPSGQDVRMDRFADRFDARGYADDEPIGIDLSPEAVGSAYRLHVLGALLQRGQLIRSNAVQREGFAR